MAEHVAKAFTSEKIHIDGQRFLDCEFKSATLIYEAGPLPRFEGCTFDSCRWELGGAADRTMTIVRFMESLGQPTLSADIDRMIGR